MEEGYQIFPKSVSPKVNVKVQLEFELTFSDVAVQPLSHDVYECVHVHVRVFVCVYMYGCAYVCMYISDWIYVAERVYICMHVHVYMYVYNCCFGLFV